MEFEKLRFLKLNLFYSFERASYFTGFYGHLSFITSKKRTENYWAV